MQNLLFCSLVASHPVASITAASLVTTTLFFQYQQQQKSELRALRRARSPADNRVNPLDYFGLAKDMEILTDQGFLNYEQFKKKWNNGLRVATFNSKTKSIEYETPTGFFAKEGCHDLYQITVSNLCIRVTVNHPVLHYSYRDHGLASDRTIHKNSLSDMINNKGVYNRAIDVNKHYFAHRLVNHAEAGLSASEDGSWCIPQELLEAMTPRPEAMMPGLAPKWSNPRRAIGPIPYQELVQDFLYILGYWLGDGSLNVNKQPKGKYCVYVTFAPVKACDVEMLCKKFDALGLTKGVDFSSSESKTRRTYFSIYNKSWVHFFAKAYGFKYSAGDAGVSKIPPNTSIHPFAKGELQEACKDSALKHFPELQYRPELRDKYPQQFERANDVYETALYYILSSVKSAKWLLYWMFDLSIRDACSVLQGLSLADGCSTFSKSYYKPLHKEDSSNCVYTSSVIFRDQLSRFILHAGCTGRSTLQAEKGTERTVKSTGQTLKYSVDHWKVYYGVPCYTSISPFKNENVEEIKSNEDGVWGVRTRSGTLIIRGAYYSQAIVVASM